MRKILSLFAAMLMAFAVNATVRNITPTHCFEGDRADGYTLYVELARGAQAGDTIVLADGEYQEGQSIPVNVPVVIMAAEGAHPVVKMSGYFQVHASVKAEGIKFQFVGQANNGYCFYLYENTSKYLALEGCEFQDFTQYCVSSWEAYHIDSCIVNNCYFHDLAKAPFYFAASSLENNVNACDNLTVTNSTFANITLADVAVLDLRNNNNSTAATSKLRVDHCTFYNCKGYERMIQSYKSPDVLVSNCIMMNPLAEGEEASIYATYLYGGDVKNCLWFQTKRVYTKKEGGAVDNINVDPLFVAAATGNYTLAATSPAIGAGLDGSTLGDPRWYPAAPVEPILANGFYLIGQAGWDVAALDSTLKFAVNPANENEYMLHTTLAEGDSIKVVKVESDAIAAWYPAQGANYGVDAAHAGEKDIYFQEAYKADWAAFGGHIYIAPNAEPQPIVGTHFVKVTEAPAEWAGEYLIVYETGNVALNGALEALDATSNTVAVEIANGKIASTDALIGARVTIAAMTGGYSVKAASGKYLAQYSYSNGLQSSDTAVANALSIDANGNAVIAITTAGGDVTLRYNKASNQARFRYYKSGQEAIALYKLTTVAPEPEVNYFMKNNWNEGDWAWKEMTKDGETYKLDSVVFGGNGVNYNTAASDEGAVWVELAKIAGAKIAAKDTVSFVLNPADSTVTATLIGKYIEPAPQPASPIVYNWAKAAADKVGATILGPVGTSEATVKINTNTKTVDCLKFEKSYSDTTYVAIKPAEGAFKAGDTIKAAVCFNNSSDAKYCMLDVYAADGATRLWRTDSATTINGRTSAADPAVQTYVLAADADSLLLGRYGTTAMCVTLLQVVRPEAPAPVQHTYTIAGSSDALFGTTWDAANANNDMAKQEDGTYKFEKTEVVLAAGKIEFKLVEDHTNWAAGANKELNIAEAGIYTVTITYNPAAEGEQVVATATKTGEAIVIPTVAMHGNFTGSWADTELFTLAADSATATLKLTIAAGDYEFGMRVGGSGNWMANGVQFTRENPAAKIVAGQGNLKLAADQAGEYTFTWFYANDSLAIAYPKLIPHYGVHEAIAAGLADNDLVYVNGIITKMEFKGANFAKYGSVNIYVKDVNGPDSVLFEFYNCYSLNADTFKTSDPAYDATSTAWAQFNSVADANGVEIALGDTIEAYGKYKLYNTTHELNTGCYLTVVNKYQPILGEPDYYLVGTMNEWQADSAYKFVKNEGAEGIEYKLTVALAENAELKVMGLVANDTLWYPDQADNYVVDAAHAGEAMDIYFRPNADGGNDWYHGVIFVPANVPELPEIALIGGMNGWDGSQGKFAPAADYKSAAWTINLDTLPADRGYAFKLLVDGIAMGSARDSAGNPFTFTPANNVLRPVDHVAVGDDEIFWLHMEDKVGEYTFIYTFADSSLKVVYPKVLPTTAPAAPTADEDDVMAVYCNHYATNNLHFEILGWGGVQTWKADTIDGVAIAYCEDMKYEFLTNWGAPKYDMSEYNKIHIDIWAPAAASVRLGIEALGVGEGGSGSKVGVVYNLNEGWNSIDAALEDFGYDFKDMKYVFFEWYKTPEGESFENNPFGFANIYFYEKESQALDNTSDGVKAQKYIHNGMILIEKNGKVYTITGQVVR